MQEVFEKIINQLKEESIIIDDDAGNRAVEIIEQIAAEYRVCAKNAHTGWIPCSPESVPENARHKGAFCPKYLVMTKYGETIGWYNPDYKSWFILVWFMTARYMKEEIDFHRGDVPKVVRAPINTGIVTAWQPLPTAYQQNICGEDDCPYNDGKECPAWNGCGGYETKGE